MGCVNRNGKEFKTLAQRNDVSIDNLELIVHKYWLESGSEDFFPSDTYIQAQLGNMVYQEPISAVRKLWKQRYSSSLEYSNLGELNQAKNEALKFFPNEAISQYINSNGKYVLSIKEPVAKVTRGTEIVKPKKLNLNIEEGRAYSIDKVKELFNRFNTDRTSKFLAEKVFKIADDMGLAITFENLGREGEATIGGKFSNGKVQFNKNFFENDTMNHRKAWVLLHELIHAETTYALDTSVNGSKALQEFKSEINNIFYQLKDRGVLEGWYGMANTHEFVAELANPVFRQKLQEIDKGEVKNSAWARIVEAIKKFLGLHTSSTYYNRAMKALDNALNAFDLDAYLEYNDIMSSLKDGMKSHNWKFTRMDVEQQRAALREHFMETMNFKEDLSPELKNRLKQAEKAAKAERKDIIYAQENDDTGTIQRQIAESRKQNFETLYGDVLSNVVIFKTTKGGLGVSATLKSFEELLREENKDLVRQLNWVDNLSNDDVLSLTSLLEQDLRDYDLVYNNSEFDKSDIKDKDALVSYIGAEDSQVIKGELGVNKEQLIALLGSTMYKANVQTTAVKELLQNAFDAVKIAQSQGKLKDAVIDINLNEKSRTVTISDNGTGMSPEIIQKAFFTIGGSHKGENVDNRLKSGGLGLAKMAFLFSSDYVEVTTVKDGIQTYVKATPEEIQSDNFSIITKKVPGTPSGTTVTVRIPEYYLDQNGEKRTIWFNNSPAFLAKPMIGNVTVNVTKSGSWWDNGTKSSNKNKIPEGYVSVGKATSAFGDLDIYIAPIDNPDSSYLNNEILISGLYQFDHEFRIDGGAKARFKTIINILPTVDVKSQVYPINNQRENFRTTIEPEVKDLNFLLLQINSMLEKKSVSEMFNNTISMDVRDVSDIRRIPPTPKEVALNDAIKEVKKQFSSPTQTSNDNSFELKAAAATLRGRALSEKSRNSSFDASGIKIKQLAPGTVDTSKLDIRKPIFHNNTTMVIEEDGQKVLNEFGALLMELKSLYLQTYKGQDIPTREDENITDYIEKQYWGFSFDKGYGGVNVSPKVIRLLAINPFYEIPNYKNTDIALQLTESLTHIIEHEFNHNYESGEGAGFTGRFPMTYAEFAGIGKSFNKDWKNRLYVLIRDNLQTFYKYAERYQNSTNRGESLQGGKYTGIQQGQSRSTDGNGQDAQRQSRDSQDVRDNGQGFGEEFADLYEKAEKLSNQQHLEGDNAVAWLNEGNRIQDITDRYIQEYGNKLDADDVRKAFIEIGYDGTNVPEYQKAINILMNNIYDALLDKAIKEGKKSITFVSGVAGSGKSTAIKNNRNLDLSTQGVIYDAPFNNFWTFDKAIAHAWAKGMEKISIVQMYNDAQTAFENSVRRGYETGRFLNLQYFEDSFRKNAGKLERIHSLYPQVQITAIDNTGNNGGRMVTLKEALNWDYSITEEKLYNLLKYLENELNSGRLQGHQASSVTRDIQQITSATSPRIQEIIRRIEGRSYEVAQHNIPETGSRGLGLTSEEFYTKQDALDYINDLVNIDGVDRSLIDLKHTPETDTTDEYWTVSVREQPSTNPAGFRIHSGGAHGSDHYWGAIGEKYGIPSNHYYFGQKTPFGNKEISQQDYDEGKYEVAKAAAYNYGYKYPTMKNALLIRDWAQVKYADAVFAIGNLVRPGEKLFPKLKNDTRVATNAAVTGGTGYAVAMAILHNKPVYVFDQTREKWYKNINGQWSESEVPILTPNFAGIGTREINDAGRKAIEDTFKNTFKNYSGTSEKETLSADNVAQQTPKSSYNKISSKEAPLQIYSDGSDIKGTGNIGYGSVFELDGKEYGISGTQESEEVKKLQEKFPDAKFSNPTMEMLALTTTLEHFANVGNGEDIVINQDYKGAVNYQGLWEHSEGSQQRDTKAWKAKEPYIAHLVERASTAIDKIVKDGGSVKINWVKGHQSGTSEQARMNNAADRFAKSRNISNNINDAYEKQNTQQQPIQQNLPGPETKINIYAGTNENADLSNFAKRPFDLNGNDIESVEQGFHIGKFEILRQAIASGYTERDVAYTDIMNQITDLQNTLIRTKRDNFASGVAYGARLRSIGNTRLKAKDSDIQYIIDNFFAKNKTDGMPNWENDKTASNIMRRLLKASFEQNPQALQRLLATGNATLTHTQDKGKWGTEFPRLLMEVREELRGQQQQTTQPQQPNAEGNMTFSYGDNKRADVSSTTTFDAILNGERTATTRYESDGHIDYWKNLKVGDIIKWKNGKGREVLVKVTKPLTKLSTRTSAEEWSKKEGWSVEYFNSKVKPKLKEAWQIEYELMVQQPTQQQPSINNITSSLIGKEIYVGTKDNYGFHNDELFGKIIDIKKDSKGYLATVNLNGNEYTIGLNNDLEIRNTNSKFYEILLVPENYNNEDDWLPLKSGINNNITTSQQQNQAKENKQEPQFTKVNDDFATTLINHLRNDKLEGYESVPKRAALIRMAETLFDYFKKNDIKIVITNAPYSDTEKGRSSAVTTDGRYAAIFYQEADLQGGKYLNILHELLHIATNNAIPFDWEGRAIADEKLQMYYDLFKRKLQEDKEWKDIQGIAIARNREIYDRASDRAKILAHAYSKAGEFISCAISNVEVQRVLESITYGETQASNLFEELRNWFKEVLEKIFHGYSYIAHENFLDDVTDFLLNTKYTDNTPAFAFTEEEQKAYDEYLKSIEDRYNNAKDFVNPNITKLENIPEKNSNFVIQLPNYQNYYGMTEVEVDAQWKVDELNSLEEEFTQDMTNEEREELISKMDKVLSSLSKEEYLKSKTKKEQQIEKNLDEYDDLTNQITNLMESNLVTASEVRHIAELVINAVSDDITAIQKDPGLVSEWFPSLNSELDFRNATRREIVDAIGIMNLLERAKRNFDPAYNEVAYDTFEDMDIAQEVILPNWNGIIRLASTVFAENEGFGISMNFSEGKFETTSETNIGIDDSGEYKSIEDVQEKEGDAQEYWQIESRTIDVLNTMSQLVRLALHQAYLLDKDGNKVLSKWGIPERVSTRKAVNNILRWTQKSQNLPEMIEKLSEKAKDNPWIQQIIDRLSDKSGNEADFQSQFYSTFQKHYQLYSIVKGDNGIYSVMIVNEHPALTQTLQNISSQFQAGLHPLFTTVGTGGVRVKRDSLGFKSKVTKDAPFTLYKALSELEPLEASLKNKDPRTFELDADNKDIAVKNITGAARILGFYVSEDLVEGAIGNFQNISKMTQALRNLVNALEAMAKAPLKPKFNPFKTYDEDGIRGYLSEFLLPMTELLEDDAITAFYDSGKMYQSYVTPSFTTKLMNKFKIKDKDEYRKFINEEYGQSEWYYGPVDDEGERSWRFGWMKLLGSNSLDVFDHKVQLNFNSHNYMKTMNDNEYTLSLIAEYFAYKEKKNQDKRRIQAWFRAPMESNKPSSEFFRFYSDRSFSYKDNISKELYNLFLQEAARIITVRMRDKKESDPDYIKNWDKNGKKFTYLQFLNSYLEDTADAKKNRILLKNEDGTVSKDNETLAKLIQAYINREEMSSENSLNLITLTTAAIKAHMQQRADKILADWERKGIVDAAMTVANAGIWETTTDKDGKEQSSYNTSKEVIRERLENFIWNDKYAAINILQLMVGDTALYTDAEDLQKRLAQLHSPGIRANKDATDYQGRPVSDGKYRTILIKDFNPFKSNIIANLTEVFDRRIAEAPESERPQWEAIKDDLLRKPGTRGKDDKGGRYWRINVTDGQGYSSLSSYRKKAFMFGRWSRLSEDIYNKIRNNDYTFTELETAFQPLKPFVYTHLQKYVGVEGSPISTMNIAFQAKNSEYLLIMADALLQNEKTERPNLLRAISRIMEDSERLNPTKGIDTVQYGSAIKSGLQAEIDLTEFVEMPNGEEEAYKYMRNRIYRKDGNGNITNQYDTDVYVHETSYDDYCLQQDVPEHFKDHEQAHGSQERMILPSDLPFWKDENGPKEGPEAESNINYYEWDEINEDGEKVHRKLNAIEFRKAYEENIAKGIEESIKVLEKELGIDKEDYDKRDRNIRLSKILQREIISSPRYGIDLLLACSVDKETGEFRIPLGDPIQAKRIEQLINSIIKNRINKQTIAGGPIVQVTNFGTSRQLHIRYKTKSGGLLFTEEEYKGWEVATHQTYEEYVKENQAGIAYFEVFAPAWSKDMLEKFMNDDGTIDIEAIKATDSELLKMISYRIPTEDKYSMAPMKIVGFMPRWAGDAIMLPYELTEIDDSDFDVDKRYVMRKVLEIVPKSRKEVSRQLETMVANSYKKAHDGNVDMNWVRNEVSTFLDDPIRMRNMDALTKAMYNVYKRIGYTTKKPKGKDLRDNRTIDMSWAVLTNQHVAPQILNPGGFDDLKKVSYKIAAEKNKGNTGKSWEDLDKLDTDDLKKLSYKSKDITWIDDEVRFYKQNAAGSNLIGVFAVNKVAHAILEGNGYHIAVDEICKLSEGEYFEIAGKQFGGKMELDPRTDDKGRLIGKVLGSGVSASADTAKDPIWDLINVNMTTASVFNTLVRLGINFEDAALFMSQDIITRMLAEHNKRRLSGDYITLDDLFDEKIIEYKRKKGYKPDYKINGEDILSREELLEGLFAGNDIIDYKVMLAFKKLRLLAEAVKDATFATRFNSISSAVGPQIVDNLIIEYKMDKFRDRDVNNGTHFYDKEGYHVDIDDILYDHPILSQFARTVDIARKLFEDMPAMSVGFQNILNLFKLTDGPMQGLDERIFKDRKLLSKLADFYQSYLLVASGVADPSRAEDVNSLSYYINEYPAEFMDKVKKRYPNNKLIQSIELGTNNRTGKVFLYINTTGMDQTEKDKLSSAWIDFHRANPEQSRQLFLYNFFRAGVGFSPKSFMSLVPTYVKERIFSNLTNGDVVSYVDTYRRLPSIVPQVVLDQFIANNWGESKLAPWKGKKGSKYKYDFNNNLVIITDKNDLDDLRKVAYMKTSVNRVPMLWKRVENSENRMVYELIEPLGNNGEYIEMSYVEPISPMNMPKEALRDDSPSDMPDYTIDKEIDDGNPSPIRNDEKAALTTEELIRGIMLQNPSLSEENAQKLAERAKKNPGSMIGFLENVFSKLGYTIKGKENIKKEMDKIC